MSLHKGVIGGNVGGRYSALHVCALHCDGVGCLALATYLNPDDALRDAAEGGWDLGDGSSADLCPECAAKTENEESAESAEVANG